jgi:VWFA-related protein
MCRCYWLLLVLLLVPLSVVSAQNTAPPQLQRRSAVPPKGPPGGTDRLVTLDVQVTDRAGVPVGGLQLQDFTLLDDKQPQTIVSFRAVNGGASSPIDSPVEIVLVVDAVNTSFQNVNYAREEVKKFLLRNGGQLAQPVSLVILSDAGTKIQDGSSRDGTALAALYDQYETGLRSITRSQGFYGATERFDMSLKTLISLAAYQKTRSGRKLMIWFSPGWPMLSGPDVVLSSQSQHQLFNSIVEASTGLRQARVTLYGIDPLGVAEAGGMRIAYYEEFLNGVTSSSRAVPGDLSLQVLAVQSGGRVINGTNDLTSAIAKCAADAEAFYVLSFNARHADQPDEYHTLSVAVDRPGTVARTRTGYYAQP